MLIARMPPAAALLSAVVTAALLVLFCGGIFETWRLWTGQEPITGYIRHAIHAYPPLAFVIAVLVGMVLGHLYWR